MHCAALAVRVEYIDLVSLSRPQVRVANIVTTKFQHFLQLAIHEAKAAVETGAESAMIFFDKEFMPALVDGDMYAAHVTHPRHIVTRLLTYILCVRGQFRVPCVSVRIEMIKYNECDGN